MKLHLPNILRNRNFVLLFVGAWISGAGDTFSFLALAVRIDSLYTDPTQSAKILGAVLIAFAVPQILIGLLAGTLVDRLDRRRVMMTSDLMRAAMAPLFILLRRPSDVPLALALAFLMASFGVFFNPARTALMPRIVAPDDLMSANGWMQVGQTMARLTGPILAGLVIGRWGTDIAFGVDAFSFLVAGLLVMGIRGVVTRERGDTAHTSSAWREFLTGVRYARGSRLLRGVTLGLSLAVLGLGAVNVLFVPFMRHAFDAPPTALGMLMTAQGIGMLAGGLLMGWFGKRLPALGVAVAGLAGLGMATAGLGLAPGYGAGLVMMPVVGLTIPPLNASLNTMLQRGVPGEMLGRAGAVLEMAVSCANLTSMGAAGWVAGHLGLRETFVTAGAIMLAGGVLLAALLGERRPETLSAAVTAGCGGGAAMVEHSILDE
jgi:MFS transporter, DHA3 family, macrolide efflux protein